MRHTRAREDSTRERRRTAWLTRAQLINMYGGESAKHLVDSLIAKKIEDSQFREHPDLPGNAEATLYNVPRHTPVSPESVYIL